MAVYIQNNRASFVDRGNLGLPTPHHGSTITLASQAAAPVPQHPSEMRAQKTPSSTTATTAVGAYFSQLPVPNSLQLSTLVQHAARSRRLITMLIAANFIGQGAALPVEAPFPTAYGSNLTGYADNGSANSTAQDSNKNALIAMAFPLSLVAIGLLCCGMPSRLNRRNRTTNIEVDPIPVADIEMDPIPEAKNKKIQERVDIFYTNLLVRMKNDAIDPNKEGSIEWMEKQLKTVEREQGEEARGVLSDAQSDPSSKDARTRLIALLNYIRVAGVSDGELLPNFIAHMAGQKVDCPEGRVNQLLYFFEGRDEEIASPLFSSGAQTHEIYGKTELLAEMGRELQRKKLDKPDTTERDMRFALETYLVEHYSVSKSVPAENIRIESSAASTSKLSLTFMQRDALISEYLKYINPTT